MRAAACAGFRRVTPASAETLGTKGCKDSAHFRRVLFARFYPQAIMRRIANSLHCGAATFPGFER
jgi:hypothetical protein